MECIFTHSGGADCVSKVFLKLTLGFEELVVCLKSTLTTFAKNMVSVLLAIKGPTTYMAAFKMRFTAEKTVLNTLLGR